MFAGRVVAVEDRRSHRSRACRASSQLLPAARGRSCCSCCSTSRSPTSTRPGRRSRSGSASRVAQDLTYTIGWLVFGMGLLGGRHLPAQSAGAGRRGRADRGHDVQVLPLRPGSLGGLYRVASLVGLAISLALVSLALQKLRARPSPGSASQVERPEGRRRLEPGCSRDGTAVAWRGRALHAGGICWREPPATSTRRRRAGRGRSLARHSIPSGFRYRAPLAAGRIVRARDVAARCGGARPFTGAARAALPTSAIVDDRQRADSVPARTARRAD